MLRKEQKWVEYSKLLICMHLVMHSQLERVWQTLYQIISPSFSIICSFSRFQSSTQGMHNLNVLRPSFPRRGWLLCHLHHELSWPFAYFPTRASRNFKSCAAWQSSNKWQKKSLRFLCHWIMSISRRWFFLSYNK